MLSVLTATSRPLILWRPIRTAPDIPTKQNRTKHDKDTGGGDSKRLKESTGDLRELTKLVREQPPQGRRWRVRDSGDVGRKNEKKGR